MRSVVNLLTKDSKLGMTEKDAFFCFGMSKMTVKDENDGGLPRYNIMTRPEFYEFIARAAAVKYQDLEEMTLTDKIEMVLDQILPVFGLTRVPVDWEAVEDVENVSSDDSVEFSKVESNFSLFNDN